MGELREQLAELEHKQWVHWTDYMLSNLEAGNIERWEKQIKTSYFELTEKEKEADRKWADKVLSLVQEDDWWKEKAYETAREKLELLEENNKLKQAIKDVQQATKLGYIPALLEMRLKDLFEFIKE